MDTPSAQHVAAKTQQVIDYSNQLSKVFHNFALASDRIPLGLEQAIGLLNTSNSINQLLALLNTEAQNTKAGELNKLFSDEGLQYVQTLITESALAITKLELIVADGCLTRKERIAAQKAKRKAERKNHALKKPEVDFDALKINEAAFLEQVENGNWSRRNPALGECASRLVELQVRQLLICRVVSLGQMSKDVSSGTVDIKKIVAEHERVLKTADQAGLRSPSGRRIRRTKTFNYISDSSSGTDLTSSDSDSDTSVEVRRRKPRKMRAGPPPPPSPGPVVFPISRPGPPPPPVLPPGPVSGLCNPYPCPPKPVNPTPIGGSSPPPALSGNPPAYSPSTTTSTLLGTVSGTPGSVSSATSAPSVSPKTLSQSVFPDEKKAPLPAPVEEKKQVEVKEEPKPLVTQPPLFKSKPNSLGFKVKSLFRSKESLAQEMQRTLSNTKHRLMGYLIQDEDATNIPHSAFHSLEATHMKTILAQLNTDDWYKTFMTLTPNEHETLDSVINPGHASKRELVVLKTLQQNRMTAWLVVLHDLVNQSMTHKNGRILLAIVRETLVDGEPRTPFRGFPPPPPPGPAGPVGPPFGRPPGKASAPVLACMPVLRPPPGLHAPTSPARISDLRSPPLGPRYCGPPGPPPGWPGYNGPPPMGRPGGPPPPPGPRPPQSETIPSIRISDTTPVGDYDATVALTTFAEYTLHFAEALNPTEPKSWSRIIVTLESTDRHLLHSRIENFQRRGGNVIEAKLRLSVDQNAQVTRIMDDLRQNDRDSRFDWSWAEISLFNDFGEIKDFQGVGASRPLANMMHLIAKRAPKIHLRPLEMYDAMMNVKPPGPPPGFRPGPPGPPPPPRGKPVPIRRRRSSSVSSSGSGSDSSCGSEREIKIRRGKYRRRHRGSDSDNSDSEEEDPVEVKIEMKKGEDLVKILLERWTPTEEKGKGKA